MMIDNIRVIIEQGPFSAEDAQYYIERIKATTKFTLKRSHSHVPILIWISAMHLQRFHLSVSAESHWRPHQKNVL